MKSETFTLSFLPEIDDLEYGGELLARDWEPAITDENKMFRGFIKRYEIGSYIKTYLDIKVCRFGLFVYFRFGYGHKTYGTCSPLAKDCSSSIHRWNSADFVTDMMLNILYYRLQDDGNLENDGRKEIIKLFDKIKDKITNDLKWLDNGKV